MTVALVGYEITQVLHESASTLVCRGRTADGERVVLKVLQPAAATDEAVSRFRAEYDLTVRAALPGVVEVRGLEEDSGSLVMVLEDVGGESLDRLCTRGPVPMAQFLDLATELAHTVAALHDLGIIHKDLNPGNIVLDSGGGHTVLVDFGIADDVPERTVPLQPPAALEKTLTHMSPEQTGRMNRAVDYRTDFYSLGVTFYQMTTGQLPFAADDALGLAHRHLAQVPIAPHQVDPTVPETVSRIILKLLAKMPEDRYQSGRGLAADLARCRDQLAAAGMVGIFDPGLEDFSEHLHVPQRLYGRESGTRQLFEAFDRAVGGALELVLVTGNAGAGKTVLVREIHRPVLSRRGYFIEGKFDQLHRNMPYSGWIQAFAGLVNYVLMEAPADLDRWRQAVLAAVRSNGRVLTDIIPNLELVIGPQPDIHEADGVQARNRLDFVFGEFVRAIATDDHPLVVFLDDLQWIDPASLGLLRTLVGGGVRNLLVVGAYRDEEVDELHPLTETVEVLRKEGVEVGVLNVGNLSEEITNRLVADTLRCPEPQSAPLNRLIHSKTAGNPFFTLHTLRSLADDGALAFDVQTRRWRWDLSALTALEITDNVVTLMLEKIRRLPAPARRLLPLAACVGFRFDVAHLAVIAQQREDRTRQRLRPALREGLVVPMDGHLQFVHDRVQQAAYSLIPTQDRQRVHLQIGRLLRSELCRGRAGRDQERLLLAVADHLNLGATLLTTAQQRHDLARLDAQAGTTARASAAFSAAAGYFMAGVGLLDDDSWTTDYDLALQLHTQAADAAWLIGDFEAVERHFTVVARHARTPLDLVGVYRSRMNAFTARGMLQHTLDCELEVLALLGVRFQPHPTAEDAERALREVRTAVGAAGIETLGQLPPMTMPTALAAMEIIDEAAGSAFGARFYLYALLSCEGVKLALRHGLAPQSPEIFCDYALVLCALPGGDVEEGFDVGVLATSLAERGESALPAAKVVLVGVGLTWQFKRHLRDTLAVLEPLYAQLKEAGEFVWAGYVMLWYSCYSFLTGRDLAWFERRMGEYDADLRRIGAEQARLRLATFRQAAQNLLGWSACPWVLDGEAYDRAAVVRALEASGNVSTLALLHVNTLMLGYLFERYDDALAASEAAEMCRIGMLGNALEPVWHVYDCLTRLAVVRGVPPEEHGRVLDRVGAHLRYLAARARHAPMNYLHVWHLVEAERARVLGDTDEAITNYGRASILAQEQGFIHEAALADELAARFWAEQGNQDYARLHLERAHRGYRRWQAWAKVAALEAKHPFLVAAGTEPAAGPGVLDLKTVMKGTAAISREIDLNRLLTVVMRIVIENAGAQSGLLLRPPDGTWTVVASGKIGTDEVAIQQANRPVGTDDLAMGVVRYVARTRQFVVLDDAHNQGDFVDDPYVVRTGTRSLLCAPLLTRGRLVGVLYLENNLTTHAFTAARVQLLEMVLTPAATALENADAYEALRVSEAKYRQIVDTTTEGIWMLDRDGRTTFVNARMAGMLGLDPAEAIGRPMSDFLVDVQAGEDLAARPDEAGKPHIPPADGAYEPRHLECRLRRKDGQVLWGLTSTALILDAQHEVEGSLTMVTDITDRKNAEDMLAYKAHHDDLTGLPNRAKLLELLHSALARALRTGTRVGVLFIDLDDFKSVNDSFGHTGGDEFLVQVADRITHMLRETDAAARIGGDEFVVVCENLTHADAATIVAQRVQSALGNGVQISGRKVGAPASIGIAISNEHTTAEVMLRDADAAMYAAKRRGGRIWSSADPLVHTTARRMFVLEANLREAVRLDQLRLHYQPTFDLRTGLMVGVEALLRWEHPSLGLLLPKELIEVAERRDLIRPIGTWALRTACAQASAWIRRFGSRAPVVAVNISTRQLGEQELSRQVRQLLADNDLPPDKLCLEITESQFISVGSSAINELRTLSEAGIAIAVDDFGTGFSGFDYLRRLPVDTLKIDKSYVDGLGHDQTDTAIVASIVALAHNLGLITIAEGIEAPVQRDTLRELGCSVGQGWLWHPALPAQELEHLLEARQVNDDDCDPRPPAERGV